MPFGEMTQVGPGNHVLDGGPDPTSVGALLKGDMHVPYLRMVNACAKCTQQTNAFATARVKTAMRPLAKLLRTLVIITIIIINTKDLPNVTTN